MVVSFAVRFLHRKVPGHPDLIWAEHRMEKWLGGFFKVVSREKFVADRDFDRLALFCNLDFGLSIRHSW